MACMNQSAVPASPASQLAAGLLFLAALAATFLLYRGGLSGGFLFDDFQNLGPLEQLRSDPTVDQLAQFLLHGISSPTGRPISLATFAMQMYDWPTNPAGFLYVNLLVHLLNGALLFWWLLRLAPLTGWSGNRAMVVPLIAAMLWLIAPIQITAVIYVVQRMTELSATFVFIGMLLYVIGRHAAARGAGRSGLIWMSLGIAVGGILGVFAKENAILMPLLVVALEFTLLAAVPRPAHWRVWSALFLGVPAAAVVTYLAMTVNGAAESYAMRAFTLGERVMTEARVLFIYLHKTLVPWPSGIRLLYDDLAVSKDLLHPWTTLPAVLGIAGLAALGIFLRRRLPLLAFAVLWFVAAHLLESTVIPLELAFEHRNYQASVGLWLALAGGVLVLWDRASARHVRVAFVGLAAAYALLLGFVTSHIATLWGQPLAMAAWWAEKLPDSRRAQLELIGAMMKYGLPSFAVDTADDAAKRWPDNPVFHLTMLQLSCLEPTIAPLPTPEIQRRMRLGKHEMLTAVYLLDRTLALMEEGICATVSPQTVRQIVDAASANPALLTQRQNLLLIYSRTFKLEGRRAEAGDHFRQAVELGPAMILLIQGVLDELDAGRLDRAREYLRLAESDPRVSATDRWSHRKDIESLRYLLSLYEAKQAPQ
jgi:tetratricopeptide (TPR) repeat protein